MINRCAPRKSKKEENMVLSQAHAEEIFWLKRRMQFVFEYDALTKRQAPIEELMALASSGKWKLRATWWSD
jgi:hypothetical protein